MSKHTGIVGWRSIFWLLGPSVVLLLGLQEYLRAGSAPHFFLHALMGWDVGMILLLAAMRVGRSPTRWDGWVPIVCVLYAQIPDFLYLVGPFHRDWMDVFLFHVSLDEILPVALAVLAPLWVLLLLGYMHAVQRA